MDAPETVVANAISCGLDVIGMTDHHYWFLGREEEYQDHILHLQAEYRDRIRVLCGIELATYPVQRVEKEIRPERLQRLDFAIVEHLGVSGAMSFDDFVSYRQRFPCPMGIAHTDLFGLAEQMGRPAAQLFEIMAERNLFWELNVNYDTIHGFREHAYVLRFFQDKDQQRVVRNSGVGVSVGFDCHNWVDYDVKRVTRACAFLEKNKIPLVDIAVRKERGLHETG